MGEWMKPHNVKWGAETDAQAELLFGTYPELERNLSRLVRRAICRWYKNAIAPRTLQQLGEIIQELQCAKSVRTQVPLTAADGALKCKPQSVSPGASYARKRPKISATQRMDGEAREWAWKPSFRRAGSSMFVRPAEIIA